MIINYTTTRPIITRDLVVYKNSNATTDLTDLNSKITEANSIFMAKFNISFNRSWSRSTSALNERTGCNEGASNCCDGSCGTVAPCATLHHKSALHFLEVNSSSSTSTFRFVSYPTCYYSVKKGTHGQCYGLCDTDADIIVSLEAPNLQRTTCHELSHWFGARDEVCTPGQSCVMTYDSNVTNKWCAQCTQDILNNID